MGWCSGTDVYIPMSQAILNSDASDRTKVSLLVDLIDVLRDRDWDCYDCHSSNPLEDEAMSIALADDCDDEEDE